MKRSFTISQYPSGAWAPAEDKNLLSNDIEVAWLQDDEPRCRQRITALDKLLKPEDALYSIVRFYEWLLEPEASWTPLLMAIKSAGEENRYNWNFQTSTPKIEKLPLRHRQAAGFFIDYFEGKSNLEELQKKLDALPKQATASPQKREEMTTQQGNNSKEQEKMALQRVKPIPQQEKMTEEREKITMEQENIIL